jgi:hypothetical protein
VREVLQPLARQRVPQNGHSVTRSSQQESRVPCVYSQHNNDNKQHVAL